MLLNFTNHPSSHWSEEQQTATRIYGGVCDFPFPDVPPTMGAEEVKALAEQYADVIASMHPDTVLCQGEYSLAFHVTELLRDRGIPVVVACTERRSTERTLPSGEIQKTSVFGFVGFRRVV